MKENKKAHHCEYCNHYATQQDPNNPVTYGEDPFNSEIHDDHTKYWLCSVCIGNRREEV